MNDTPQPSDGGARRIWTIGHSTRSSDEFLELLRGQSIALLVDVRRYPGSRRFPHFGRDALRETLAREGIAYRHMPALGGRRRPLPDSPNVAWRNDAFRGYADYMDTQDFQAAAQELMQLATESATVIMCAEAVWWSCHRSLISDYLKSRGFEVLHVLGPHSLEPHPYTSAARIVDGRLSYRGDDTLL